MLMVRPTATPVAPGGSPAPPRCTGGPPGRCCSTPSAAQTAGEARRAAAPRAPARCPVPSLRLQTARR
eukprot:365249-Chlamydomonas_euryale.AAC.11